MFDILNKIDDALESKEDCVLVDKMGKYFHGKAVDSWVRVSGAKLRGKLVFDSKESGEFEIDANDILELRIEKKG